jgi:AraC-like DNA-binding protein
MRKKHDFGYIRSTIQEHIPQLLSVNLPGKPYFFQLETFHLHEFIKETRVSPKCHSHKVFHIVQYTDDSPETNMRINNELTSTSPGSIVMLPPEVPHVFQPTGASACYDEITFSMVDADGEPLSDYEFSDLFKIWSGLEYQQVDYAFTPSGILCHALQRHYQAIGQKLQNSGANLFPALSAIAEMMFSLMEHMTGIKTNADPRLLRAQTYIENNYLNKISLKSIARQAAMSHEHFCKQFKKEFGLAPLQYRQQLRMNAAEKLLSISELQITEIADRLGFSDIYAFSRAFKNHTGVSPVCRRKPTLKALSEYHHNKTS